MKEKTIITLFCICLTIMFSLTGAFIHIWDSQARTISLQRTELDEKMDKDEAYYMLNKYLDATLHDIHIIAEDIASSRQKLVQAENTETIQLTPIQAELLMGGAETALE